MQADLDPLEDSGPDGSGLVLEQLPTGLLVVDASGTVVLENGRLRSMWGAFVREPPDAVFPADARSPDGRPLEERDWPIWPALYHGATVDGMRIELERPDGDALSLRVSSRPLVSQGRICGAAMVVDDVTDQVDQNILRDNLVSVLSHELRTPITSIFSAIGLLERGTLARDVLQSVVGDIAIEAETLHRIIEDLLVMARLERHVGLAVTEPILVQRVASAAIADERRRWPESEFVESMPRDLPPVAGDEGLVRQVLRNLLSNAAKYGRQGGTVAISGSEAGSMVEIRVADDGPGIPPAVRERIFELFYRGDETRAPGAGIGLYVVRALVESMGGTVSASGGRGGAVFTFTLPVWTEHPTSAERQERVARPA